MLTQIGHLQLLVSHTKFSLFRPHLKQEGSHHLNPVSPSGKKEEVALCDSLRWPWAKVWPPWALFSLAMRKERTHHFLGQRYCHNSHCPRGRLIQTKTLPVSNVNRDWLVLAALWKWSHVYLSAFKLLLRRNILGMASCTQVGDCLLEGLLTTEKTLAKNLLKQLSSRVKGSHASTQCRDAFKTHSGPWWVHNFTRKQELLSEIVSETSNINFT